MTPTERKTALITLIHSVEALARDVRENPDEFPYTPNARALTQRLQTTGDDLLQEAKAGGWLTPEEAADALFQARHAAPAAERKRRDRVPR